MSRKNVEDVLFDRLSVFGGAFTLDAVQVICTDENILRNHVDLLLTRLAERSLLLCNTHQQPVRYRVPQSQRSAAYERLIARGEAEVIEQNFIDYYRTQVIHLTRKIFHAGDPAVTLEQLEDELDNIRAMLQRLLDQGKAEQGLRLAGGSPAGVLLDFWIETGRFDEGRKWIGQFLALPAASRPTAVRAYGLHDAGVLAWIEQDFDAARAHFEESLSIMRQLGSQAGISEMLDHLAGVLRQQGDLMTARSRYEESLTVYRTWGKKRVMAETLERYGQLLQNLGEVGAARAAFEECRAIYSDWNKSDHVARVQQQLDATTERAGTGRQQAC